MDPSAGPSTVVAPMQATVVSIDVDVGDVVHPGRQLVVLESMKMEHVVAAETAGVVAAVRTTVGATVAPGDVLVVLDEASAAGGAEASPDEATGRASEGPRADLAEVLARHEGVLDAARPDAVARRRR